MRLDKHSYAAPVPHVMGSAWRAWEVPQLGCKRGAVDRSSHRAEVFVEGRAWAASLDCSTACYSQQVRGELPATRMRAWHRHSC